MQHLLAKLALALFALLLPLPTLTAAKHAECYWTGPGKGTPEAQGFSKFGVAKQFKYTAYPDKPTPIRHEVVQYICFDYDDQPVVADWNNLRNQTLEMATPCGDNGYSGDCTYGLWGFRYEGEKGWGEEVLSRADRSPSLSVFPQASRTPRLAK